MRKAGLISLGLAVVLLAGCTTHNNIEKPLTSSTAEPVKSSEEEEETMDEDTKYIAEFLNSLYEDGYISEELKNTSDKRELKSGLTVIGDAIPVKTYRTLAEAEETFGKYLGLRNTVNDGTIQWELVQMAIIDEKVMQGIYDSGYNTNFNVKMTYTEKGATLNDLISMYDKCERYEDFELNNSRGQLGYSKDESSGEERVYTAYFIVPNGKIYSIHNASGFSELEINTILNELTYNLMTMDDWKYIEE